MVKKIMRDPLFLKETWQIHRLDSTDNSARGGPL